jgi:hypothetical protein
LFEGNALGKGSFGYFEDNTFQYSTDDGDQLRIKFLFRTPLFSGYFARAKRRQGCPVEGRPARNELELFVMEGLVWI